MSSASVPASLRRFDLSPAEAREAQQLIPSLVEQRDRMGRVCTVAGADIALDAADGYAAVIVYSFPELRELERAWAAGPLNFPYVPGLLAFREIPLLLQVFSQLTELPDLILADAHGWAHPRRAGMACHLGLLLDRPVIGCAKSVLVGEYHAPGFRREASSPLCVGSERLGTVLRTRDGVRPVFVSVGHRVSLRTAARLVLACCDGYRIPKPQREADRWVKELRRTAVRTSH